MIDIEAITTFPDLIRLYRAVVTEPPTHLDDILNEPAPTLGTHLSWMLDNMPDAAVDPLKFHRWLGFAQCLLFGCGYYSLDQLRDQTRRCSNA